MCLCSCAYSRKRTEVAPSTVRGIVVNMAAALITLIILTSAVAVLVILMLITMLRLRSEQRTASSRADFFEERLSEFRDTLDTGLHRGSESVHKQIHSQTELMNRQMRDQFESSKKLIEDITREITEVKTTGREMLSFTEQLQSLERVLKNPQRRGAVGEYVLEQVVANVLPPDSYGTQHSFKNGVRADVVIFLRDGKLLSVDAKFSLENYVKLLEGTAEDTAAAERQLKEDLKKRIQETAKYILPKEGTLDYAFMFIPSESLYYDLLTQRVGSFGGAGNMLEYAFNSYKVIIVSPTTLLAYLQTVNLGLRSLKVEEHAQEIISRVEALRKHLEKYSEAFRGVGRSLGSAVNKYNEADRQYGLIDKDVLKITGKGGGHEKEFLDRPRTGEV